MIPTDLLYVQVLQADWKQESLQFPHNEEVIEKMSRLTDSYPCLVVPCTELHVAYMGLGAVNVSSRFMSLVQPSAYYPLPLINEVPTIL